MKKVLSIVLIISMIISFAACGKKDVNLADLTGLYYCEQAERASLKVLLCGDELVFNLRWSSSAVESMSWDMSGKYENGYVVFEDMYICTTSFETDENGAILDPSYDGTGVIEFKDDTLTFVSCSDDSLEGLTFQIYK